MRKTAESLMTDEATIRRAAAGTVDMYGHHIPGTATTTTSPCRIITAQLNRMDQDIAMQADAGRVAFHVVFPHDVDLVPGDVVEVGGQAYDLLQIEDALTDTVSVKAMVARRVTG